MGRPAWPSYGNIDLGSAVESAEIIISKIKTNKYTKEDVLQLVEINNTILKNIVEDALENDNTN